MVRVNAKNDKFFIKKSHLFWFSLIFALIVVFYKISSIMLPFYIGFLISILFGGIVNFCEKKWKIPRMITSLIITLFITIFFGYILISIIKLAITGSVLSVHNINDRIVFFDSYIDKIDDFLKYYNIGDTFNLLTGQFTDSIRNILKSFISNIFGYGSNFISMVCFIALSPIVVFMMLKDLPIIKKKFFLLLPKNKQKEMKNLFEEMHNSTFKYLEGQTLVALILSIMYSIVLFILKSDYYIILGIIIGFSSFIPYIGFYSAIGITLFSIYQQFADIKIVIFSFIILMICQIVDSGFITPRIVGDKLGVHPLLIIFGVLASVPLFGIFGILFALPIIGICGVIGRFLYKKYITSGYYNSK